MANNEKISGKLTGNKLNISISTNSTGNGQNTAGPIKPIEPIESTASKVKSIAEISTKNNEQQDKSLNKKQVVNDKNQAASDIQEIQILKSIEQKLQDLNNNFCVAKKEYEKNHHPCMGGHHPDRLLLPDRQPSRIMGERRRPELAQ